MDATLWVLVGTFVIVGLAAFCHAVTGFGFALLAVPLLGALVGARVAVVTVVVISLFLYIGAWTRSRGDVDGPLVRKVVVASLVGMPLGLLALAVAGERLLLGMIAGGTALFTVLLLRSSGRTSDRAMVPQAGAVSGALLTSTGMNGPPLVLSFQALGLSPRTFRGSLQATFAVQQVIALALFVISGQLPAEAARSTAVGLPALVGGWCLGNAVFARLRPSRHRALVVVALGLSSATALTRAVLG